jgi:hypothetical protein
MKPPSEWDESDLLELIQVGAEEDLSRDWKEARALAKTDGAKNEISKDVSAFANSDGGCVVYGLREDSQPPHKAAALSPIDPGQFPPEWLENVINSRIKPRIQGLRIKTINLPTQHPGNVAYVVYVPRSVTAHQASDKKYYRRYEFQSVPMEDYEIRLAMHRTTWPTYAVQLHKRRPHHADGHYYFKAIVTNTSDIVADDVSLNLLIPEWLAGASTGYVRATIDDDGVNIEYTRIPGSAKLTLHPGDPQGVNFEPGYLTLPPIPFEKGRKCDLIVRVYDRFGRAHEGIFTVTLANPPEIVGPTIQRPRENMYS